MDFSHISHEIFECVGINLEFSKEKYTSDFRDTWVVRCSYIDVLLEKVYNISGQVSVHDLHFKIGLDYEQNFTKLVLCLQHENSVNDLVYPWVGNTPENNHNFSVIFKNGEISHLLEHYHVPFTFASIQSGNSCINKIHVVCRHLIQFINEDLPKGM